MTPQWKEASDLRRLSGYGFSPDYINGLMRNGWTLEKIIQEVEGFLNAGLTTESHAAQTFQEAYPDALNEDFAQTNFDLHYLFQPLSEFEEKTAEWLIPGYIPKGQIVTLASDGGIGKTSLWVNLAAAISSGIPSFLDESSVNRKPQKVLFMSTEDSVSIVLKRRLRLAGARENLVIAPDFSKDRNGALQNLKFGTPDLEEVIANIRPALCIFDPLQGFTPKGIMLGDRGAMRGCMEQLLVLGEKYGTTFLIIAHTNKRTAISDRGRIADSADLWDISRSVMMLGWAEEEGIRYLSHEKCNYGTLQQSILFSIDSDGLLHSEGKTWKRDRDYQADAGKKLKGKKEDCQQFIIRTLEEAGGKMRTQELERIAEQYDFSVATWKRAKAVLGKENKIRSCPVWENGNSVWYTELTYFPPSVAEAQK